MAVTRSHRFNAESKRGERAAMAAMAPTLAYLHIQTDDDAPTRVLELGATPVRIGRGIQCEVRLNQVGLGDVQCLIRRRNDEWQMQPVGPPGRIWLDNRPTDQQRPLPVGASLRVGRSTLIIQLADPANQARGSFDAPITVNAEPIEVPAPPAAIIPPVAVVPEFEPELEPDVRSEPEPETSASADPDPAGPVDDRVQRWQSRLDQRDRWLRDRQSEKRWEARWKAAGETIRARSEQVGPSPASASPPAPPPPPVSTPPSVSTRSGPPPSPADRRSSIVARSTPIRTFEPRPVFGHLRRGVELDSKAEPITPPVESTAILHPVASEVSPPPLSPPALLESIAMVEHAVPIESVSANLAASEAINSSLDLTSLSPAPISRIELDQSDSAVVGVELETIQDSPPSGTGPAALTIEPTVELRDTSKESASVEIVDERPAASIATVEMAPLNPNIAAPVAVEQARPIPQPHARTRDPVGPRRLPTPADPEVKAWPSAQAILAAQGTRATAAISSGRQVSSRQAPEPTIASPPETWVIPFALGWLPALALVLGVGGFTIGLAGIWVSDSTSGNLAIRLATRLEARSPTIDPDNLPQSAWWRTTASHLAAWSIALERVSNGEDRTADARALESDARVVSPLGARARFVAEPVAGQEADGMLTIRLGPTRDVITLTAMGHRLRREGKRVDSIRAYQAAFLTAASTPRSTLGKPVFVEDSPTHRYSLPHATLLDPVARDMADAGEWSAAEWAAVVPDFGPARLAVAIALRVRQPAEADRLLEALCQNREMTPDPRFEVAEHHAAIAEALAARDRWGDAIAAYHRAIDDEPRDLDRRVWWFNLAELAGKNGESDMRNQAIENAKGLDLSDEVTQRAANANQLVPDANPNARHP